MEFFLVLMALAVIQGVAEFLPVSSSGHLVIFEHIPLLRRNLDAIGPDMMLFLNVLLHLATLVAVIIYLRRDIAALAAGFLRALWRRDFSGPEARSVAYILAACVPAALIGVLFHDFFERTFSSPFAASLMLIANGIMLITTKKIPIKNRQIEEMGIMRALLVGCAQAVAILPGISRSGSTIAGGFLAGLEPEQAARFSFLMAIPVILGAGLLESLKLNPAVLSGGAVWALAIASLVAIAVALVALRILVAMVKRIRIDVFGYYTIAAGIIAALYFSFC